MRKTGWIMMLALSMWMVGCNRSPDGADGGGPAGPTTSASTRTGGPAPDVSGLDNRGGQDASADPAGHSAQSGIASGTKTGSDDAVATHRSATAVFAGGCFWCVEAVFEQLNGVMDVVSGYSGGTEATANYESVCTGATGHAEAVQITYDPAKISYEKLLSVHLATHDPTTLNRQGADYGTQYRSAIFYANEQEKQAAQAMIERLNKSNAFNHPIVTTLEPLKAFYKAESHHQNYVCNNPYNGYVQYVAMPKVDKVRKLFKDDLKKDVKP